MNQMEMIKSVQQKLITLGYDLGKGGADGILGTKTRAAVAAYQKSKRLGVQYPGTIGPKTLKSLGIAEPEEGIIPPWVAEARRRIGLHEARNNKTLKEYLKSDGKTLGDPAKLPWCGDFMETVILRALPNEPMVTNPYWALNWTKFGVSVPKGIVPLGAIAPFKRPGGGHIGIIVGHDKTYYHVLGGNQSNSISVVKIAKSRQEGGLRWPSTYALPGVEMGLPFTTLNATISSNEA